MLWFKIIRAIFIITAWAKIALKDGKVTIHEAFDLIFKLAKLLGLPTAFNTGEMQNYIKSLPKPPPIDKVDFKGEVVSKKENSSFRA